MAEISREQQIEHILEQIEKGRFLSKICEEDEEACSMSTFLGLVRKDTTLAVRYADAREAQITSQLEEIIGIADDVTDDAEIWTDPKTKKQHARINGKTARRAEVMIAARERFAKLMMPERFAQQRMDLTSGGKALPAPVQQNDNRIVALLTLAATRAAELHSVGGKMIDVTPASLDDVMS